MNLPERVENNDPIAFLERWLPEALGHSVFSTGPVIQDAYQLLARSQPGRSSNPPRTLILKFLNYQDRMRALRAARSNGKVLCDGKEVMFPDLSPELVGWLISMVPMKITQHFLRTCFYLYLPLQVGL